MINPIALAIALAVTLPMGAAFWAMFKLDDAYKTIGKVLDQRDEAIAKRKQAESALGAAIAELERTRCEE